MVIKDHVNNISMIVRGLILNALWSFMATGRTEIDNPMGAYIVTPWGLSGCLSEMNKYTKTSNLTYWGSEVFRVAVHVTLVTD